MNLDLLSLIILMYTSSWASLQVALLFGSLVCVLTPPLTRLPKKPSPLTRVPVLYKACFSSYEVTLYCGKASVIVRSIWHQRRLSVSPGQRGGAIGSVCPWWAPPIVSVRSKFYVSWWGNYGVYWKSVSCLAVICLTVSARGKELSESTTSTGFCFSFMNEK